MATAFALVPSLDLEIQSMQQARHPLASRRRRELVRAILGLALCPFLLPIVSARAQGPQPELVSRPDLTTGAVEGDGASGWPFPSADGSRIAFHSDATNLVLGDTNGKKDVFVRDRSTTTRTTVRVSVDGNGAQANGDSSEPGLSATGRYVVFRSDATNLAPSANSGIGQIFWRDLASGATEHVSLDVNGGAASSHCSFPTVSADGNRIAFFTSSAMGISPPTNGLAMVYVRDRQTSTTTRISLGCAGAALSSYCDQPMISADGQYVSFECAATNLLCSALPPMFRIYRHDLATQTTILVSTGDSGPANAPARQSGISADGRYVAFSSSATNLVAGKASGVSEAYRRDCTLGTTECLSVTLTGLQSNGQTSTSSISVDGNAAVLLSDSRELAVGSGPTGTQQVFVRHLLEQMTVPCSLLDGHSADASCESNPRVSGDGEHVVFATQATNLQSPASVNGVSDVFLTSLPPPFWNAYCLGDGTQESCPCQNPGGPGHGCENGLGTGGGLLQATGTASVGADTMRFDASHLRPTTSALFFQGTRPIQSGPSVPFGGIPFGNGLRCVGGDVLRLGIRQASAGSVSFGDGIPGDPAVSLAGLIPVPGCARFYQVWYRDVPSMCLFSGGGFNLTNALVVYWTR